jgi:DNA-binding NtrC family response regulator
MADVLVVDDEAKLGRLLAEALEQDQHRVVTASSGAAALFCLGSEIFDVVITDLRMPNVDGLAVLAAAKKTPGSPEVVMMTAHGSAESAVAAMKAGAADYLIKPFSIDELRMRVRRLSEQRAERASQKRLLEQLTPSLVAVSPPMAAVLTAAQQVAKTDTSVLLLGESGTGKSQLARLIHFSSGRSSGPFAEVHCAALPEGLLESGLFGHEKGAFTGADRKHRGHLSEANGGTLFLDEIGEITPATQVKLLRFLQTKEFIPVGATKAEKVELRVIAATNRDLKAAVRDKSFREDFFYRLNVFSIELPPLRERPEDVLPLAHRFLGQKGVPAERLERAAEQALRDYPWPGNVRELENALERALVLAGDGPLLREHLVPVAPPSAPGADVALLIQPGFNLDAHERSLLFAALERTGGNKSAAARLLGISRRRLYSRLNSLTEAGEGAEDEPSLQ